MVSRGLAKAKCDCCAKLLRVIELGCPANAHDALIDAETYTTRPEGFAPAIIASRISTALTLEIFARRLILFKHNFMRIAWL